MFSRLHASFSWAALFFLGVGLALPLAAARGVEVPLTIEAPGGGEVFLPGQSQVVRINKKNQPLITEVELSTDNGVTFTSLGQINKKNANPALRLSLEWTVPATISSTCLIRVHGILSSSKEAEGESKAFSIGNAGFIIGAGALDHGDLQGLLDDDHPQYLNRDGSRPMTGDFNLGGKSVLNGSGATYTGTVTAGAASLSGNLIVAGNATITGIETVGGLHVNDVQLVLDADNTGPGGIVSIIAEQGTGLDSILRYNPGATRWEISTDAGANFAPIALNSPAGGANADTLDALDSVSFLRSDASTAFTGPTLTVNVGSTLSINGMLSASGAVSFPANSITDAMVQNTLTASDLVSATPVVSDAEVDDNLTISGGTVDNTVIGGLTPAAATFTTLTASTDNATVNSVTNVLTIIHSTSGTAANGIGTGVLLRAEDAAGSLEDAAQIAGVLTNVTDGAEASELRFFTRTAGGALTQGMALDATGSLSVTGNLTITGTVSLGGLDMQNNVIQNIGNAGTDFTATGGLTLADDLNMSSQPIVNIGNAGTNFSTTGGLTLADILDMSNKPIVNIGVAGTAFTTTGGLTLADTLTVTAGSVTLPANSIGDAAVVDNLTINGGTINNTIIGGTTALSGSFTTVRTNTSGTNTAYLGNTTGTGPLLQLQNSTVDCFVVSSTGKLGLGVAPDPSDPIVAASGARLTAAGLWSDVSDRNKKTNFTPVNSAELLERVGKLPITAWNYKCEGPEIRHIGPMAQDFFALFQVGIGDTTIAPLDSTGVALAAIQELKKEKDRLAAENQELKARQAALDARLAKLEAAMQTRQAP